MDVIFNMHKIKYSDMDKLLGNLGKGSYQIFINMESLMRKLIRANVEEYIKGTSDVKIRIREFISNVLNLAAHYRKYFTNKGRKTEIIMYMSEPDATFNNSVIVEKYRNNTKEIYNTKNVFGKFLRDTMESLKLFFNYIEGVYFITCDRIEPSLIPYILKNGMNNQLIITTDRYEYQYCDLGYMILRPKAKGMSYSITKENVITKMKIEDSVSNEKTVQSNFVPLILSFVGDSRRSIPKVKGLGLSRIINLLRDGIDKGFITENTSNIQLLESLLSEDLRDDIKRNFMVTDLSTQMHSIGESTKIILNEAKIDRFDNVSLKKLNDIFREHPIMIEELQPLRDKAKSVFER